MQRPTSVLSLTLTLSVVALSAGCGGKEHASAPTAPTAKTVSTTPSVPSPKGAPSTEKLEPYSCGTVERLHTWNGIFAGSQPAAQDLHHAQENGVKTVLNFRPKTEDPGFDEAALVKELGLEYQNIPFASPAELTDEVFEQARTVLRDESKRPLFAHCHSGNRVGAIWLAFRVLDGGVAWDAALEEAKEVGMKSPALEQRAKQYIEHVVQASTGVSR